MSPFDLYREGLIYCDVPIHGKKKKNYLREISHAIVAMPLSVGLNEDFVGIH